MWIQQGFFRQPCVDLARGLLAQYIHTLGWGKRELAARKVGAGVEVVKADGGVVAEAVAQLHGGQGIAAKADADKLIAGIIAFGRGAYIVDAAFAAIFFEGVAGIQRVFVGQNGRRAVADGLVLSAFGYLRQVLVVEPNGGAVAHDGLLIRLGVIPFKQAGAQDLEVAVGGLAAFFALHGLAEGAADAVGVGVEFF